MRAIKTCDSLIAVLFKARGYTEDAELFYNAVTNLEINANNFSAQATITFGSVVVMFKRY